MPQDADEERLPGVLHGLDDSVLGPGDLAQAVAEPAETLVMVRLDRAADLAEARVRGNADAVLRELAGDGAVLLVPDDVGEVLNEVAAAHDVQHLGPAADRQHGEVALERRRQQRELAAVACRVRAVRRRIGVGAVRLGGHVVAAREDEPVERVEHLLDPLVVRRHEHGAAARPLDGAHVVVRDERRLEVPVPPRGRLDVRRDPDQRLPHPRSNIRSRS